TAHQAVSGAHQAAVSSGHAGGHQRQVLLSSPVSPTAHCRLTAAAPVAALPSVRLPASCITPLTFLPESSIKHSAPRCTVYSVRQLWQSTVMKHLSISVRGKVQGVFFRA